MEECIWKSARDIIHTFRGDKGRIKGTTRKLGRNGKHIQL